jgi:hypothetical protein
VLAARDTGSQAEVIDAVPESLALPPPRRQARKRTSDEKNVGQSVGRRCGRDELAHRPIGPCRPTPR